MKGVVWNGPYELELARDLPDPRIEQPRDAIVRVTRTAICGTDLHPYRGEIEDFRPRTVLGHEFAGVVEAVGPEVVGIAPGDAVVASDIIACGRCWACTRGLHYHCEHVSLFGYGDVVGPYVAGGQAEYVRIPFADVVLGAIPEGVDHEQALFAGDVLATGFTAAARAGIEPGDTVAVVGCGPVGLCAAMSAELLGAGRVLAVDQDRRRAAEAERQGAAPIVDDDGGADVLDQVHEATEGRGADVVLEAVGTDASLATALGAVRPRGTVVAVGAHATDAFPLATIDAFARELTLRFAVGDPIATRDRVLGLVRDGRLDPSPFVSHRMALDDALEGYRLFDRREATKVVLAAE